MGTLIVAKESIKSALSRLNEAIEDLQQLQKMDNKDLSLFNKDRLEKSLRDSLIRRFEFCIELFWKYIKRYEEEVLELKLEMHAPRPVITAACKAKIISEPDAEIILEMLSSRNFTSHLYKEEIAEQLSIRIPVFYSIMTKYIRAL